MAKCLVFFLLISTTGLAQVKFSLGTDFAVLRNFDEAHSFTVIGQTVLFQWHLEELTTIYAGIAYYKNGRYSGTLVAEAKQPLIQPPSFTFTTNSEMRIRNLSFGLKRYVKGNFKREGKINAYAGAGFGLLMGEANNYFSRPVDTTMYSIQNNVTEGSGDFKRLSFDLSLGGEIAVVTEIFLFTDIRVFVPTTDYPSPYLLKNEHSPFLGSINLGLRVLFNYDDD